MGFFAKIASQIFGYQTEGVPASGWKQPELPEIIAWGTDLERIALREEREVTAAGAITVDEDDLFVVVNKTVGAATTVNLCAAADFRGDELWIKDGKGDAGTNTITIDGDGTETIDGMLTVDIPGSYGMVKVKPNKALTGWHLTHRA